MPPKRLTDEEIAFKRIFELVPIGQLQYFAPSERGLRCSLCDEELSTALSSGLQRHLASAKHQQKLPPELQQAAPADGASDGDEPPARRARVSGFTCAVCGEEVSRADNFRRHEMTSARHRAAVEAAVAGGGVAAAAAPATADTRAAETRALCAELNALEPGNWSVETSTGMLHCASCSACLRPERRDFVLSHLNGRTHIDGYAASARAIFDALAVASAGNFVPDATQAQREVAEAFRLIDSQCPCVPHAGDAALVASQDDAGAYYRYNNDFGQRFPGGCAACGTLCFQNEQRVGLDEVAVLKCPADNLPPERLHKALCIAKFNDEYYHLDAAFVDDALTVSLCDDCAASVAPGRGKEPRIPKYSFADGWAFGSAQTLGLEPLTPVEKMVVSRHRVFARNLKFRIVGSSEKLHGHMISFPHNGPQQLGARNVRMPSAGALDELLVCFVGRPTEQHFREARNYCQVRRDVVRNWLHFLKHHNRYYADIHIAEEHDEVWDLLAAAAEQAVAQSNVFDSERAVRLDRAMAEGAVRRDDEELHSVVEDVFLAAPRLDRDVANGLLAAARAQYAWRPGQPPAPPTSPTVAPAVPAVALRPETDPVNDFEDTSRIYAAGMPWLFPIFREGVDLRNIDTNVARKLIFRNGAQFKGDSDFLFYAFNQRQRHRMLRIIARPRANNAALNELREMMEDPELGAKLTAAIATPNSQDSQRMSNKLARVLSVATGSMDFTTAKRRGGVGQMRAMALFGGMPSVYITISPADMDCEITLRIIEGSEKGGHGIDYRFPVDLNTRARLVSENGAVAAEAFHQLATTALREIICVPPHADTYRATKAPERAGVFGVARLQYSVVEAQGRGSLHLHGLVWTDLDARALVRDLVKPATRARVQARLDRAFTVATAPAPPEHVPSNRPTASPRPDFGTDEYVGRLHDLASLQQHLRHGPCCFKGDRDHCRFGIPSPTVPETGVYFVRLLEGGKCLAEQIDGPDDYEHCVAAAKEQRLLEAAKAMRRDEKARERFVAEAVAREFRGTPEASRNPEAVRRVSQNASQQFDRQQAQRAAEMLARERNEGPPALPLSQPEEPGILVLGKRSAEEVRAVPWNNTLTAAVACNTAIHHMGSEPQAENAMYYLVKYLSKDLTPLSNSLVLFQQAFRLCQQYESSAGDAGTAARQLKLLLTRFGMQHLGAHEVSTQMAAACVLGNPSEYHSHNFVFVSGWAAANKLCPAVAVEQAADSSDDDAFDMSDQPEAALDEDGGDDDGPVDVQREVERAGIGVHRDNEGNVTFVNPIEAYVHRGAELQWMNLYRYMMCVSIVKKPPVVEKKAARRPANATFEFDAEAPESLRAGFVQRLRSKLTIPQLVGPRPPKPPAQKPRNQAERTKLEKFCRFATALFRPWTWRTVAEAEEFCSPKAFGAYLAVLRERRAAEYYWVRNLAFGGRSTQLSRRIINCWRFRDATRGEDVVQPAEAAREAAQMREDEEIAAEVDRLIDLAVQPSAENNFITGLVEALTEIAGDAAVPAAADPVGAVAAGAGGGRGGGAGASDEDEAEQRFDLRQHIRYGGHAHQRVAAAPVAPDAGVAADAAFPFQPAGAAARAAALRVAAGPALVAQPMIPPPDRELSADQRAAYDAVIGSLIGVGTQKLFLVHGGPGCGKSYTIGAIANGVAAVGATVVLTGSTGIAACNIGGCTIDSLLSLMSPNQLQNNALQQLQQRLRNVSCLIIDEMSMIGAQKLALIEARLREGTCRDEPYGGLTVVLVGDFFQLPPVGASPLYAPVHTGYRPACDVNNFRCIFLETQHRVADRTNEANVRHIRRINAMRDPRTCGDAIREALDSATRLGPGSAWPAGAVLVVASNAERASANRHFAIQAARQCGCPVLACPLTLNPDDALTDDEYFYFVPGAPGAVTENVDVGVGIANGTRCRVVGINYDSRAVADAVSSRAERAAPGSVIRVPRPRHIIVQVGDRTVHIGDSNERDKSTPNVRRFAVDLAYACTFHKVQGLTVSSVVLELNGRPKKLGKVIFQSLYVALTRVTSAAGLYVLESRGSGFANLANLKPPEDLMKWLAGRQPARPDGAPAPAAQPPAKAPTKRPAAKRAPAAAPAKNRAKQAPRRSGEEE